MRLFFVLFIGSLMGASSLNADTFPENLSDLVLERSKTIVALEFVVEREMDRQEGYTYGLIVDDKGTIVVLESMIPSWVPVEKLKKFIGYSLPQGDKDYPLVYLGKDYSSGWHVLSFKDGLPDVFTPITKFETATVNMGDSVFAVGGVGKELGFDPYVLTARVAMTKRMPDRQIIFRDDLTNPGCPVFNVAGAFVGWASDPLSYKRIMNLGRDTLNVTMSNPEETSVALSSEDFFEYLQGIDPEIVEGPRSWIGVSGMQPIDPEVAEYLGIKNQSGIVLSEILEGSPSSEAGLENNDILIMVDGEKLPQFRPDYSITPYFQKLIRRKKPGEIILAEVIRGEERKSFSITVGAGPKNVREAAYRYYEKLGFTIREFLLTDGINLRLPKDEMKGAIVNFVKRSSAVETAGLRNGDWIKQVEGVAIDSYEDVLEILDRVEADKEKSEFVLLVERNNETSFVRAQLK
ncbi:MAG: PDZ domain-containing protein [Verrucomicrobia bacterium]|nr:PDZ domain-containing protein [Verrucomicrobiota bacterium]MDA1067915.1 PDZ domain-containing protein [Verrucomicrobiota bacterium]